jgi:hypothetical protein
MESARGISFPRSQPHCKHPVTGGKDAVRTLRRLASYYQTPTLERLKLLSIVNRTAEPPRSEIACDK